MTPLWPDLQKDGYQADERAARDVVQPQRGGYYPDAGGPMPGPARPMGGVPDYTQPMRGFPNVGRSDLDPLAGLDGSTTGRLPYGGGFGGDGMMVGPDHPLFRDRFAGPSRQPGFGPEGGSSFLPPGAAPPGARFDPIGPGGPFPPGRQPGPRGPFGGAGRGPGGFGGEPDWDEMPPPVRAEAALRLHLNVQGSRGPQPPPAGYDDMFS